MGITGKGMVSKFIMKNKKKQFWGQHKLYNKTEACFSELKKPAKHFKQILPKPE